MSEVMTRTELARMGMDALDRERVGQVQVSVQAGGISFGSALEVMEFAKLLSTADKAIPQPFRSNPGMCLAVVFQAVEWRMSPVAVINKAYVVNDRVAYESQLLHAVVERRAPLAKRLDCSYEGEGPDRKCTVTGTFDDGEVRNYTTPAIKDIRVKNSPLWRDDPDQQLFYAASRSWARKWCPDVLLGIYTTDELSHDPLMGRELDPDPSLRARLIGKNGEGHQDGYAEIELSKLGAHGTIKPAAEADIETESQPEQAAPPSSAEAGLEKTDPEQPEDAPKAKRARAAPKAAEGPKEENLKSGSKSVAKDPAQPKPKTEAKAQPKAKITKPKTSDEYIAYAEAWIAEKPDEPAARWAEEGELRNQCQVPIRERHRLQKLWMEAE